MKGRTQELLRLLTLVVDRVRAANGRAEQAESRAARMSGLLDALSDDNAAMRSQLDQADDAATEARETIRFLRERIAAGERLAEVLEARAAEAELRIRRAAQGLSTPLDDPAAVLAAAPGSSVALH